MLHSPFCGFLLQSLMNAKPISEILRDSNDAGLTFLLTDSEMALTLLGLAESTADANTRSRRIREARKAYDTIVHLLSRLKPDAAQSQQLSERVSLLRKRLVEVGALEDSSKTD